MTPKSTGCTFCGQHSRSPYSIFAQRPDVSAQRPDNAMPKDLLILRLNHLIALVAVETHRPIELWAEHEFNTRRRVSGYLRCVEV